MKMDRLLGILVTLLRKERTTAPVLAEKFEVTRRTIGRDIDALCRAGIPIITQQGNGGGISIAEGYRLDKSILTTKELAEIVSALGALGSVSQGRDAEKTLQKLSGGQGAVVSLKEPIIIDLASHYKGELTVKIQRIKQAIVDHFRIAFDYYYEKGQVRRTIEPAFIVFMWSSWYVFGFCIDRQDFRMFKLQRLWDLTILTERFVPRDIPRERLDFASHLADDKQLVALFDISARYQLIETYGLDCCRETEDGRLRLEIAYTNEQHILSWLLSFGDKAQVLEPAHIAQALRDVVSKMAAIYTNAE